MKYSPKNIKVACDHKGLTHFGGVYFFHEFLRVMQLRHFLACHLIYPRRNSRYHLSQMIFDLMYPIVLGLDRIETASFLRGDVLDCHSPSIEPSHRQDTEFEVVTGFAQSMPAIRFGSRSDQARQRAECWVAGADLGESGDRILQASPSDFERHECREFVCRFFCNVVSKDCKPIRTRSLPQDQSGCLPPPAPCACESLRPLPFPASGIHQKKGIGTEPTPFVALWLR